MGEKWVHLPSRRNLNTTSRNANAAFVSVGDCVKK